MSPLKKQRIDLRFTDDDKSMIEQHRRWVLNEASWARVMQAISNPPAPDERLKRAAKRLQHLA